MYFVKDLSRATNLTAMEYQINKNEACTDTYYIYKIISFRLAFLFSSEKQKVKLKKR